MKTTTNHSSYKALWATLATFLLFSQTISAQDTTLVAPPDTNFSFIKTIQADIRLIEVDKLGRLYLLTEKNVVIAYNMKGDTRFSFSGKNMGPINRIDATDPMNILVSSGEFQQLVLLDRTLNPISSFGYYDLGLQQVGAVGMSNLNAIWAYDSENYRLKCFDPQGRILRESGDLSQLLGLDFAPDFLLERGGNIYLVGKGQNISVFDGFGNYLQSIDLKPSGSIQFFDGDLYYLRGGAFFRYDPDSFTEMAMPLPVGCEHPSQVLVAAQYLFVRVGTVVKVYEIL